MSTDAVRGGHLLIWEMSFAPNVRSAKWFEERSISELSEASQIQRQTLTPTAVSQSNIFADLLAQATSTAKAVAEAAAEHVTFSSPDVKNSDTAAFEHEHTKEEWVAMSNSQKRNWEKKQKRKRGKGDGGEE